MKYTGSIIGFKPMHFPSIYTIIDDDKAFVWKADVVAEISKKLINVSFEWRGYFIELELNKLKEDYYVGMINFNKTPGGSCSYWLYTQQERLMLKGEFVDYSDGKYDSFIEVEVMTLDSL